MKYPKSVFFILASVFCDTFANIGLRTVLPLYFVDILRCNEDTATILYHTFILLCYLNSVIISLFADSRMGRYRILLYIGIIYMGGQLLLSMTSLPALNLPLWKFSMLSIFIITLCPGTVFTCIMPFAGDQFQLPRQQKCLDNIYAIIYLSMSVSMLLATLVLPILRKDVTCFGMNSCYPLSFTTLTLFATLYTVVLFSGRKWYTIKKSDDIVAVKVMKCIYHGIAQKIKVRGSKHNHWLDYANDKYDQNFIDDIKALLKVLVLFIPAPMYYAAFRQQNSRWTFQASRMNGEVFNYLIKPDQFHVAQPFLLITLIPCLQFFVYPLVKNILHIGTPLRKMTIGGLLLSLAFAVSGIVELKIEPTHAVQPSEGSAHVRIFNTIDCNASLLLNEQRRLVGPVDVYQDLHVHVSDRKNYIIKVEFDNCFYTEIPNYTVSTTTELTEATATSWILTEKGISSGFSDRIEKSRSGDPKLRALMYLEPDVPPNSTLILDSGKNSYAIDLTKNTIDFIEVIHDQYKVIVNDAEVATNFFPKFGGVYTIIGHISKTKRLINYVTLVEPNSIHMFWQLPQYILICMSEMMFIVTALEFLYSQGPSNMKSLLYAVLSVASASGDLIVILVTRAQFFERQVIEFFFYALLLFIDMLIFAIMAVFYKYVNVPPSNSNSM